MRRSLLRSATLCAQSLLSPPPTVKSNISINKPHLSLSSLSSKIRFFSSGNDSSDENSKPLPEANLAEKQIEGAPVDVEDVSNKEMKMLLQKYFKGNDEKVLPSIFEAVLKRKLSRKHEETDDELLDELQFTPLDNVDDEDFESDFEEGHETDEEIDDLYDAADIVKKRMANDEYFNMDDEKWDDMINEATAHGYLKDTRECEEVLEDMLSWDKLLPDRIKQKVEEKFNEIGDMVERGELEPEEGYELFKQCEDEMVLEYGKLMEAEGPPSDSDDDSDMPVKKHDEDDPPGEGPILRWTTRAVFAPGGDAWHPKNRKVKMAVTVKELGLSKHQSRRLRELVGKRYHPGKDELTITSERFEHREENRKDCLRTLFSLIEEAGKANKLVEEARTSYVKERLRANPEFMERLRSKTMGMRASNSLSM